MDYFTIDTIFGRRFYVFFIPFLKTCQIVRFGATDNPTRLFVRQQLVEFRWDFDEEKYITYFNQKHPHQSISQEVPEGYVPQKKGKVVSHPVLWDLHHNYHRLSA